MLHQKHCWELVVQPYYKEYPTFALAQIMTISSLGKKGHVQTLAANKTIGKIGQST